ncbi:ABC transporter substrate-binding protein [Roseococcus sp. SDR]|uniref:ABC transporter substrate-binding protein n=1 Tax=Roseococcus sp. SDR TaxID=2835532 RepID=UPI001BD12B8B|nr:ABC transporter substrate-binding protein [Roseococcus sp. SDR]MBS7791974.1 ABC transporter substrate-binding protein [Roseococcus sp. SDR]MBV1847288.1 ABC transporter substrate-binding protein [Roseococcus sp. SDR]
MRRLVLACVLFAGAAQAQDVNIAVGGAFTSLDPHFHNLTPNSALTQHLFDRLLEPDADLRPQPGLAESYRALSPTSWEFRLRPGIRFHDGTPFTADDVAFTFARVPNVAGSPASYAFFTRPVREVVIVDALTFRLETHAPAPLIPAMMQGLPMIGRRQGEGMATSDYNSGRAAIGTGPYRFVSYAPGDRAVFARNTDWYGGAVTWNRVTYRFIGNDSARLAALKAGDVDLIDQVPTRDVADLARDGRLTVFSKPSLRNIYLYLDGWREQTPHVTDHQGRPLPANPLRDVRVRRALSLAINRPALVAQVMDGQAAPSGQLLPAGAVGHDPALVPDRYDPEQARRLLAEAGYPQGFMVALHGPNDRYVNDAQILQAIAQMWARIGVRVRVEALPSSAFFSRSARDEFSIGLLGWGTGTGEPDSPLANLLATIDPSRGRGASNRSRYSNPRFDAAVDRALATLDLAERESVYREATGIAMADQAIIPLHHQVNIWAARRGFTYAPRNDERTLAMSLTRGP